MKLVGVYLALVGIPLALLAGILHAGQKLRAPHPIAGEWRVESVIIAGGDSLRSLTVIQSGEHVDVTAGASSLRGRFDGDSLSAARYRGGADGTTDCAAAAPGRLRVRFDTASVPMRMWGTLVPNGAGCAPVSIAASHVAKGGR